jgi:molybdopterin molybdotransferase
MAVDSSIQRVSRLTPLSAILALIEARVGAVAPQKLELASAHGATLAEPVAGFDLPEQPTALRDGFAVEAAAVADAGPYAPVSLTLLARRVDTGMPLPRGTDAMLPLDAVELRGKTAEAMAAVLPGEGVLPAGGDASPKAPLRRAGERLRDIDIAVLAAAGITEVTIRRPRIRLARGSAFRAKLLDAALALLAGLIDKSGARLLGAPEGLESALADDQADAVIALGGTGSGRRDDAVHTLARLGNVEAHGIAMSPGETTAFGFIGDTPVLLVPGRLDAVLAVWVLAGRHLVARLAGAALKDASTLLPLKRKVTSTIGMTDLIPVRSAESMAEPLASGYLSFTALTHSDGWIVVPGDSEGFAAGAHVAVRPWP